MSARAFTSPHQLHTEIHNTEALANASNPVAICPPQFMTTLALKGSDVARELALCAPDTAIYTYDHPGTGRSRRLHDWEFFGLHSDVGYRQIAEIVWKDVFEMIPGIDERPVRLVGHSMGAYAVAHLFGVAPKEVAVELALMAELPGAYNTQRSRIEGVLKSMTESRRGRGRFPYEPTQPVVQQEVDERLIDREAKWAYIDTFRRKTARAALRAGLDAHHETSVVTIRGGRSLLTPQVLTHDLILPKHARRTLEVIYTDAQHAITDNPRVFAEMATSYFEGFAPIPKEEPAGGPLSKEQLQCKDGAGDCKEV